MSESRIQRPSLKSTCDQVIVVTRCTGGKKDTEKDTEKKTVVD